jgi:hypothetical protein
MQIRSQERPKHIFISYRVKDKAGNEDGHAGRLWDRLKQKFPADVFLDREGIEGGELWEQKIEKALECCQILIVLVTPAWRAKIAELKKKKDWVRKEIEAALRRKITILVVRAGGALPLTKEELKLGPELQLELQPEPQPELQLEPYDLEDLVQYQAATPLDYSGGLYDESFNKLTDIIERQLGQRRWTYWVTGLGLVAISALLLYWIPAAFPLSSFYTLLLACSLASPALALWLWNRRWKKYSRGIALFSAFFLPAVLIALFSSFLNTPVLILSADRNLPIEKVENILDGKPKKEVFSTTSPKPGHSEYIQLWRNGSPPVLLLVSIPGQPAQCVAPEYQAPFPISRIHLGAQDIHWSGVVLFPELALYSELNDSRKSTQQETLKFFLREPGSAEDIPLKPTIPSYKGGVIWIGNGGNHLQPKLPEMPPGVDPNKDGMHKKYLEEWGTKINWIPPISPCGITAGSQLRWQLTTANEKSILHERSLPVTGTFQTAWLRSGVLR